MKRMFEKSDDELTADERDFLAEATRKMEEYETAMQAADDAGDEQERNRLMGESLEYAKSLLEFATKDVQ